MSVNNIIITFNLYFKFYIYIGGSNDVPQVHELLECIDGVNRNYSYFNPSQLAHWKGPKLWKTQAMVKALKSSSPSNIYL